MVPGVSTSNPMRREKNFFAPSTVTDHFPSMIPEILWIEFRRLSYSLFISLVEASAIGSKVPDLYVRKELLFIRPYLGNFNFNYFPNNYIPILALTLMQVITQLCFLDNYVSFIKVYMFKEIYNTSPYCTDAFLLLMTLDGLFEQKRCNQPIE